MSRLDLDALARDLEKAARDAGEAEVPPEAVVARVGRRRVVRRGSAVAAALAVLVGAGLWLQPAHTGVQVAGVPVAPNAWVVAQEAPLTVDFEDGSSVSLARGARLNVERVGRHRAQLRVDSATATVSVQHHADTEWLVSAGPWAIEVTGTRFNVTLSPEGDFVLEMLEGSVRLRGPTLDGPRVVLAGQRFERKAAVAVPTPAVPVPAVIEAAKEQPPPSTPPSTAQTLPVPPRLVRPEVRLEWRQLARAARFEEAYGALRPDERGGARLSATDLLLLADVLRLSSHADEAIGVLEGARAKFPGTPEAARASFTLGVLAFPSKAAVAHFGEYLREAPEGALAEEALGRQLECHRRLGDDPSARAVAARYLTRYPSGGYVALAKQALEGP